MRLERFDVAVWGTLGTLGLVLGVLVLSSNWIGVRTLRTFPDDSGEVGRDGRIGIEFAQPMQVKSVEALLQIEPTVTGTLTAAGRILWFTPRVPFQPDVTYTARLRAGAQSQGGLSVKQDRVWRFHASSPWVVYLAPINGPMDIWRIRSSGGAPEQVTHTGGNVYDYAVSTRTRHIVYSVFNQQKGIDLWLTDADGANNHRLVDCGPDRCSVPAWSPDGARVAFSREGAGLAPGSPLGAPRVWTVDVASGQSAPLYQESQVLGYGPSWSPDGTRLAMYDGSVGGLRVLNLQTSEEMVLPTLQGEVGTWSPDGQRMLYADLTLASAVPYVTLYIADFTSQEVIPVIGREPNSAQYGRPAWSPTGDWLAVSQMIPTIGRGNQIWLMRPDGSEGHAVTNEPQYAYGGPQWDPWGQALVFQRFELNKPYPDPEILTWTQASGKLQLLVQNAGLATWLP